ncbi:nucleotide exchange factor GrpE [Priestia taiwanensis]|uniref:Protein GrpE n=1 Tax=Priestia taiwanensis TaxID=1347902 RepID=A0A917AU68_9BACI|nr:nucleotide exchange factor GrpE [Priestia taiwanensis]MBM7363734.1 molecular chaperone GrpE [Priestia taiwanensis]GGE74564.1 protein GrpE [Priestia taiwanensis]
MVQEEKEIVEQEEVQTDEAVESNPSEEKVQTEEKDELTAANETIAELQAKLAEVENRALRAQADFENYRRRTLQEKEAANKYRAQNLVTDLLPVLDNFERALKVEEADEKMAPFLQGMNMVYRQLLDAMTTEGLEVVEAVGKEFDPYVHQAVMQVEDSEFASNTVVEEFQKGYKLKDRVIRPSMVKVNQ